jgi:hypothetical protein
VSEHSGHDDAVLPERSADDVEVGWGGPTESDDDERLIREKPPHY